MNTTTFRSTSEPQTLAQPDGQLKPLSACLVVAFGLLLGMLTIFWKYDEPSEFFWDENYHVASAQKYLNRIFFQEPHPPLGKLLIAAGEWLIGANTPEQNSLYLDTNHAKDPPAEFSFKGYRLFPVAMAALCVPLLGVLVLLLTRSPVLAVLAATCFGLDNALIVHLRGAMLEGPQLFLLLAAAVSVALSNAGLAGLLSGLAFATKINSAPAIAVFIAVLAYRAWRQKQDLLRTMAVFAFYGIVAWACVWQIHFALGRSVRADTYKASPTYLTALQDGEAGSLQLFPTALREAQLFFADYQRGVPALNICKLEENGSYPLLWPFGAQSINYRWERKDGKTGYLYLQANPAVWLVSLLGIIGALALIARDAARSLFVRKHALTLALLGLYFSGIALPLAMQRVFYLYHFFIPLITGVVLAMLCLHAIAKAGFPKRALGVALSIAALVTAGFLYFAPLSYGRPISDQQLKERAWLSLWNLRCAGCTSVFPIARPDTDVRSRNYVFVSGIRARKVTEGWGETRVGMTDEGTPLIVNNTRYDFGIGTHANSRIDFELPEDAVIFEAIAGIPDSYRGKTTSVVFSVELDGETAWKGSTMRPGDTVQQITVPLHGKKKLTLVLDDADDGITDDHAAWLEPRIK